MKRLIKKAFGKTLYHITDFQGFANILRDGMIFNSAPANAGIDGSHKDGQDRLDESSERHQYKEQLLDKPYDYRDDHINSYLGRVFLLDEEGLKSNKKRTYGNVAIKLRISEDALLPDNNDCPLCKTAEESLNEVSQCAVIGDIAKNYFDSYLFFNHTGEVILEKQAQGSYSSINDFFNFQDVVSLIRGGEYTVDDFVNQGFVFDEKKDLNVLLVASDGTKIKQIKNPSEEVKLEAVKSDGLVIQLIENPSEKVKIEAVKNNGSAILFIEDPSEEVKLEAVKNYGLVIQHIENPSLNVQIEAVKNNGSAIRFIEDPSEKVKLEAVKSDGLVIQYIENPSEKTQLEAVKQIGISIYFIKNPSEEIQIEAVKQNPWAIENIENPSEKTQLEAVRSEGFTLQYIKNPSKKVQLEAVKQSGFAIQFIKNPSEEIQLEAVKQNKESTDYIVVDLAQSVKDFLKTSNIKNKKLIRYW